jgi:hypothetical protein
MLKSKSHLGEEGFSLMRDVLRVGATWSIRCSSSREDLSYGRNRWLVNRVRSAASHSTITSTFQLQHLGLMSVLTMHHGEADLGGGGVPGPQPGVRQ